MNFLKKIFSPTILTIFFLLLLYTFYKSEIVWDGYNRNYYKTYYLISSILICFSIITFFIKDEIKQYLIISGISLIVSLYLFEGYLTFKEQLSKDQLSKEQLSKEQLSKKKLYEKQTGNKWDTRGKLEIYKELKENNKEITVFFPPSYLLGKNYHTDIFSLSGLSNSETIYCNENGYYSIYKSDRYGFNNPDSEWDKKEIEYLLVGDSFTHGACVNRPNDIGSVLRNLSNKSVLNLGMGGNGPLIEYATLREYLKTNVKKVLYVYYEGNDFRDLKNEKKNQILIKYLKDLNFSQNLKLKQDEIDILSRRLINNEKNKKEKITKKDIRSFLKLNETRTKLNNYLPENQKPNFETKKILIDEFIKILNLTKDLIKQNNLELYFVYLPEYSHYKMNYDNTDYILVKKIVNELKIPFIDIHQEVFLKEQNPLKLFPFELFGHYNIDGFKKIAETIYKFTKN